MLKNKLLSAMGGAPANYIEDVFSTYLYTGNGSTQTITNGIDLAGEGGLVWFKSRSTTNSHRIFDTARGIHKFLNSSDTGAQTTNTSTLTAFNSTGFDIGSSSVINTSGELMASWTFRKQPKFFDVVTYTGTGTNRTIAHNLGSAPGCVIIKCTSQAYVWAAYHRGMTSAAFAMQLQATDAQSSEPTYFNSTAPTSTVFSVGTANATNQSGQTYVAYLFAHNAGGFGLTGTDNVISCGSFVGTGAEQEINLGYEPQFVIRKAASTTSGWAMFDNMRGFSQTNTAFLYPNLSNAEVNYTLSDNDKPTATGFRATGGSGVTFIYIAIRRGPMKTPTSGTSVFTPVRYTTSPEGFITGFPVDFGIAGNAAGTDKWYWQSRLQGAVLLNSASTAAEVGSGSAKFDMMNGYGTGFSTAYWAEGFRRAPSFFDEVCYTGTGSATARSHNLTVSPELIILKGRNQTAGVAVNWGVWSANLGTGNVFLNATNSYSTSFMNMAVTATTFTDSLAAQNWNQSGFTYVAYLFASCPGVSKVGSYTGTGTTKQIDCGFTGGARFVLIKRTDDSGDWYVWDSARGIVAGNDPYLLLNSTAAEVTTTDYVDTFSSGFEISSTAPAAINASGGTFIYLAIA